MNRFDLYEWAVQSPAMQARFVRAVHGGSPRVLREDFAGPAAIARAWVLLDESHRAVAVDHDPEPLAHASRRLREANAEAAERLSLIQADVRACRAGADIVVAFNFGACEMLTRADLMAWLGAARDSLTSGGVLVCDLYAGAESLLPGVSEQTVQTPAGAVNYRWEQREADPVNARVRNAMHFDLPDGRRIENAFEYDWRLWSPAELRDAMLETGFASVDAYLAYGDAVDAEGDPFPRAHAPWDEVDDTFVAYLAARKA